jgi:CdiI N-terminal domain
MFAIRLLPESEQGPSGERLGEITVGTFRERFACSSAKTSIIHLESQWHDALQALIAGSPVVALPHDPRFAWVVYREGNDCYVQQKLSMHGTFDGLLPRETMSSDGNQISEWSTTLAEIEHFVRSY